MHYNSIYKYYCLIYLLITIKIWKIEFKFRLKIVIIFKFNKKWNNKTENMIILKMI